jgi:hypothetical protein
VFDSGGNTGNIFNYAMDECGICDGLGPNIPCWDGSLICDADDCPFNPGDCPAGTVGMENYLGHNNICVPEAFSETIQTPQQGIYSILYVTINGVSVEADDWVGAFNGSVCVGGRKWDTSQCGGICEVVVMGYDSFNSEETSGYMTVGDIPTFKIYDASENAYYDADASENIPWSGQGMEQIDNLDVFLDCSGDLGGSAVVDECDVCGGDNSSCVGDVNGDGNLSVMDMVALANMVLMCESVGFFNDCSDISIIIADINGDGNIDIIDITMLAVSIISMFPSPFISAIIILISEQSLKKPTLSHINTIFARATISITLKFPSPLTSPTQELLSPPHTSHSSTTALPPKSPEQSRNTSRLSICSMP